MHRDRRQWQCFSVESLEQGRVRIQKRIAQPTKPSAPGQMTPATAAERPFEAELRFTDTFRRYQAAHVAIREALCLATQSPEICCPIADTDLFAGRIQPRLVGFSSDEWGSCAFGYYHAASARQ